METPKHFDDVPHVLAHGRAAQNRASAGIIRVEKLVQQSEQFVKAAAYGGDEIGWFAFHRHIKVVKVAT